MLGTIFLYNFILLGSTLFVYLSEKAKTPIGRGICIFIAFLIVFLPAAFRYYIGVDYHSYSEIYEAIGKGGESYVEPAYYYLNVLLNNWNLEVEWLFAIMAFLTYFIAFLSYPNRNKALYHYLYLTTFYFLTFFSLRSMIVTSLMMLAISLYIKNKKLIPYLVLVAIGTLFHKSAILFCIFPLLDNKLFYSILHKVTAMVLILFIILLYYRFEIISMIFNSSPAEWLGYDKYAESLYHAQETQIDSGIGILLRGIPFIIMLLFLRSIINCNREYLIWIAMAFCCTVGIILSSTIEIFARLERIFALAYIFVPLLILYTKPIPLRVCLVLVICVSNLTLYNKNYLTYTTQTCVGGRLSPYVSIFNKEDDESLKITADVCSVR